MITSEIELKMELIKILKDLYIEEGIENAFKDELAKILQEIDIYAIPSNYINFYNEFFYLFLFTSVGLGTALILGLSIISTSP